MKKFLFLSTFALAAAMLANGCSRGKNNAGGVGVPVLVALAVETNVPVRIDPPPVGHVMPYSTVTVHSQIQGMISEIHFQEGQEVKKGDLLFTIDPRPSQAALDQARANLERDSGAVGICQGQLFARTKIVRLKNHFAGSIGHGQGQSRRVHRHGGGGQGGHHQRAFEPGVLPHPLRRWMA